MRNNKDILTREAVGDRQAALSPAGAGSFEEVRRRIAKLTSISPPYAQLLQEVKKYDQQADPPGRLLRIDYCR